MIREITLVDFMSHRNTVIEPAGGLTVLVGPNNCGKSAVVSALLTVANNSTQKHMMRHGCRECSVTIETDDGHTITWRLKGKIVNYTIDGRDVHRLEGSVPDGLHDILKLAPVESADKSEKFDVHFATQKEPIFLLNGTGKQAATFFASSSDASRLVAMQQRHKDKTREHSQTEKIVAKHVDELKLQLEKLAPIPDLQLLIEDKASEYDRLQKSATQIEQLERHIRFLAEQFTAEKRTNAHCGVFFSLAPPPLLTDTRLLENLMSQITSTEAQIFSVGACRDILVRMAAPPELTSIDALERLCCDLKQELLIEHIESACTHSLGSLLAPPLLSGTLDLERLCRNMAEESTESTTGGALVDVLRSLPHLPEFENTSQLESTIKGIETSITDVTNYTTATEIFADIDLPPSLMTNADLNKLIEEYDEAQLLLRTQQNEIDEIRRQFEVVQGEIAQWAEEHPTCPTCGGIMDAQRILTGAEGHDHAE